MLTSTRNLGLAAAFVSALVSIGVVAWIPLSVRAESAGLSAPEGRFGRQVLLLDDPVAIPNYEFEEWRADGTRVSRAMNEFRGRVVVLNFWATWCGVCAREMPKLDRLAGKLEGSSVELIALSIDTDFELATKALKKRGYTHLRAFHDTQSVLSATLGVRGVPTTFVVGPEGQARAVVQGPADWDSDEAIAWLASLVPAKPASPGTTAGR